MLQDDAERDACALTGVDDGLGARRVDFERLFEQHVLARVGKTRNERQMRAGRRENQRRTDRRIAHQRIEVARHREIETCEERVASLARGTERAGDVDALGEVAQALRVRRDGHAEADNGDATARRGRHVRILGPAVWWLDHLTTV